MLILFAFDCASEMDGSAVQSLSLSLISWAVNLMSQIRDYMCCLSSTLADALES